jgi:ribonuclease P protein component
MPGGVGRLKRRAEFLRVAATRRRWVAQGLILQAAAAESGMDAMPRIGFTVTKRLGNAVTRNRARRRLRAAAEQVMPVHAASGHDYVLIGRDATVARPFPLLVGDLEAALRRLQLWRPQRSDA